MWTGEIVRASAPTITDGWYRISGNKNSPIIEPIDFWVTVEVALCHPYIKQGPDDQNQSLVIGISREDIGVAMDHFTLIESVAGYVHSDEVLSFEPLVISDEAWSRISWPEIAPRIEEPSLASS